AGHVSVAEDAETSFEEAVLDAVSLRELRGQEAHEGLGHREPQRFHGATSGRVWKHDVAHQAVKVRTRGYELAQRAHGRRERIELLNCQAVLRVGRTEVREMSKKLLHKFWINRVVDPRSHLDVTRVEALLPRGRWRDDCIRADELAPLHVVAEGRGQQPQPVAAIAKDAIGLLENSHARPLEDAGV